MKNLDLQKIVVADLAGLLARLGVEVRQAQPYSGQPKVIERAFRGFARTFATREVQK